MNVGRIVALVVLSSGIAALAVNQLSRDNSAATTAATQPSEPAETAEPREPIPVLGEARTLTDLDGWLNTDAESLEEIRDRNEVTVVQFWTFGCFNCKNTLEALRNLYDEYGDQGLEIVGVHAPEFDYEADVKNIVAAAEDLGVTWPIALDTNKRNFHSWQEGPTGYWPRVYLIDADGQIRLDKRGDRDSNYATLHEYVGRLLAGEA